MFGFHSIAKKIYLSIAIIVIGYSGAMLFVIVEGQISSSKLTAVSMALFPASLLSQEAVTAFEQQTKAYEEAVTLGDNRMLGLAREKGADTAESLDRIAAMTSLQPEELKQCRDLVIKLQKYTGKAQVVYTGMASGKVVHIETAGELARQSKELKEGLETLYQGFSKRLQSEIAAVKYLNKRDQIINGVAFVGVVGLALLMASFVVGSAVRRIKQTMERLRDIADGEGDPTARLDCSKNDELGELAVCFNRFVEKLQAIITQMNSARVAADAANKAKSVFLANMSHELRTPLNAILGFAQLMSRDKLIPETARNNLAIINRSGEHLLSMINDVLDLSKIEAGKIDLKEESFDLVRTMEDIGLIIGSRAQVKGLSVLVELDPDMERYIRTDLGKLRQILINLMGNAVKFTENGGIAMRVHMTELHHEPKRGEKSPRMLLEVEIQDTGSGIPDDKLDEVFDPFTQVGSIRASQMGTGLGLPISQSFALLMGGKITVASEDGTGSVFKLQVPVKIVSAEEMVAILDVVPLIPEGLEPGEPDWRILVVEDNPENAQLIDVLLSRAGLRVRKAVNGKEGVAMAQEWLPHLILMDIKMPVMDGYEATASIRATPWGKTIRIVAFTASVFLEQEQSLLDVGCDDILHKPFRDWELFDLLVKQLGIRFKYLTEPAAALSAGQDLLKAVKPSSAHLMALSKECIHRIGKAAVELDKTAVLAIANELENEHETIALFLRSRAASFDFEAVEQLVGSLPQEQRETNA